MKLYGDLAAPTSQMVALCLAEKGQSFEYVAIDLARGEQKSPEHLKRHPFGMTPVLETADGFFYESRAIIRYIDRIFPAPALSPSIPRDYARMEQFIGVEQSHFTPNIMTHFYAKIMGRPLSEEALVSGRSQAAGALDVIEAALSHSPFLAGADFSLAEITWMPYLSIACMTGNEDLLDTRPHVRDWWKRISSRPSWRGLQPG